MQAINKKYSRNILDRMTLDQAIRLAEKKTKAKQIDEALSIYESILQKFPLNTKAKIGLKALNTPPKEALNLLTNLYSKRQYQKALELSK